MGLFIRRLMGALTLDRQTFEDVEADASATVPALSVVVLSSLATGFGLARGDLSELMPFVTFAGVALAGWMAWAVLIYFVGVNLVPGPETRSSPGELLRVTGFAAAPGMVHVFAPISGIQGTVLLLGSVWMLVAMIVGVRQALDLRTLGRAFLVCVIGWLVTATCLVVIGFILAKPVW